MLSQVPVKLLVKTFLQCWPLCVLPSARDTPKASDKRLAVICDRQLLLEKATCHEQHTEKLARDHRDNKAWCREVIASKAGPLAQFSQGFGVVMWREWRRAFYFCSECWLEGSLEVEAKKHRPGDWFPIASCWTKLGACRYSLWAHVYKVYIHRHAFLGLHQLSLLRDPKIQTNHQKEVVNRERGGCIQDIIQDHIRMNMSVWGIQCLMRFGEMKYRSGHCWV